jgi:NADH-quinone oxidoreductase subunit L
VFFLRNAWLIFMIPVLSFFVILLFGQKLPRKGSEVGVVALAASWILSLGAAIQWIGRPVEGHGEEAVRQAFERNLFTWFQLGKVRVDFGIHVDGLTVAMLVVVTTISTLVHIFSLAYMEDDRRFTHYYAALSLFTSGMLILVSAATTLQMILGWEIMGLCSFMLIGHWWEEKENSDAALKAFFTTRTGDIGLLVGVSILFWGAGQTFNATRINEAALKGEMSHWVLLMAAIALFCAVIGKSAQFPLHTWLPDAMAGPTPVSALIHAATMVVAGVFLVARMYPVFFKAFSITHSAINPIAVIGATTIIIAAALAFVQNDIKKVLAYSTVSQLGYMIMGLGVGAWTGSVFHIFTHAFFKACLFLGAGSIAHSGSHHSFDMKKDMGGLKDDMPVTFWTFVVASLALAGFPLLAGFWSKDEILLGAGKNGYGAFMVIGLIGAFMTACYMTRCIYLTFFGEHRGNAAHHHPHESPVLITGPLVFLAGLSVFSGFLNAPHVELFKKWTMSPLLIETHVPEHPFSVTAAAISVAFGLAGIAIGYLWYWRNAGPHGITERSKPLHGGLTFLENKYYLDRLYTDGVVGSIKGPIARAAYWTNQNVLDGVVNGAAWVAQRTAGFVYNVIDQKIVDGLVNGAGVGAEEGGSILRTIQTGRVQQYAAVMFGAAVLFGAALVLFTR